MNNAASIKNLNKRYKNFALQDVSFEVPCGSVVGLIGENGSGKSTIIDCLLGLDTYEGTIEIFGENIQKSPQIKARVGTASDHSEFPEAITPAQLARVLKDVFGQWDEALYRKILGESRIPLDKNLGTFSRGMKAKVSLAAAICHNPGLLVLDEATGGLDPVVREEMLELLQTFMEQEEHAILMTSHITSDIARIADYLVFIQNGRLLFTEEKQTLLDTYGVARLNQEQLSYLDPALIVRKRREPLYTEVLFRNRDEFIARYPDFAWDPVNLDELVILFTKGERV